MPSSEPLPAKPYKGDVWRLVEAQHRVSTLKLTDSLEEQALLETMLDETKPSLPPECAGLDYLLAAPFRYAPYPYGSRFRRTGKTEGVFYASENVETAVAELSFYRLLFFAESPGTPFPDAPTDYSAFAVGIQTKTAHDITGPSFTRFQHLTNYTACQELANRVRTEGVEAIRYTSVRDPDHRANLAVLSPRAFATKKAEGLGNLAHQGWHPWCVSLV